MKIILTILFVYGFIVFGWVLYVAVMGFSGNRDKLGPVAKFHAYLVLAVGYPVDAVLNLLFSLFVFFDRPHGWLLTSTLQHYLHGINVKPWRRAVALWICKSLLDPFAKDGTHC